MNKEEYKRKKIERILKKHEEEIRGYKKEYKKRSIKNWLGGIIIIASTIIPGTLYLRIFGSLARTSPFLVRLIPFITNIIIKNIKFTKPLLRQIVAHTLKKAVTQGGVYGGFYGIGYSIQHDMEFKETVEIITDSILNAIVFNVLLSSFALSLNLTLGKSRDILYNFDRRKDWGVVFKKASGNPELAIKTLLKYQKGFVPKAAYKRGIGYIDLIWGKHDFVTNIGNGLKHIIAQRNRYKIKIDEFLELFANALKNGKIIVDKKHLLNKYLADNNIKIAIVPNWNGKARNWIITAHPLNNKVAKRLAASAPMSNPYDISRYSNFTNILDYTNNIPLKTKVINTVITNILKNAKILNNIKQKNIKLLKLSNNNIVVKLVWDNKKRKWVVTSFKDISKSAETNRTPDIVSNYSEMTPSQTADMINFNRPAAKRLAACRPMFKPYVDSWFHFTTELCRILNIINTNKIVNNQVVKNNIDSKLRKVLLLLLLQYMIKNKKSVNNGQRQINNNNIFSNSIPKAQNFQNFWNKYAFKSEQQRNFQYLNNIYNSVTPLKPKENSFNLLNKIEQPKLFGGNENNTQNSISQNITNSTTLNSANTNLPIPQIQYSNLPEFKPMNVELEENPVYSSSSLSYQKSNNNNQNTNSFGIDAGQLLAAGSTLYDLWQLNNKRKQVQAKNQNQSVGQGFEFIPE